MFLTSSGVEKLLFAPVTRGECFFQNQMIEISMTGKEQFQALSIIILWAEEINFAFKGIRFIEVSIKGKEKAFSIIIREIYCT